MRSRVSPVLLGLLLSPAAAVPQSPGEQLEDSLRAVFGDLLTVYQDRSGSEYEGSRPFFADSVTCIGTSLPSTCSGWHVRELHHSATPLRARLVIGTDEGWAFDFDSFGLITADGDVAVATVKWEAPQRDTTVSLPCDPAQPATKRQVGIWTLVFQRAGDAWKIKHAHESTTRPFTQYRGCGPGR